MRRKISLYIDGKLVDLDDQSLILYNYTMNDLTNPTIVKNSFSREITIPATPNNRKIFSHFGRLDHSFATGDFNPMVRTPFAIYNEVNEVLESGYMRLTKVERNGRDIRSYTISLFGGLGSLLYGLSYDENGKERTLADLYFFTRDGSTYDSTDEFDMDVAYAWQMLKDNTLDDYNGIFNFAPMYNGFPEDFDAKKAVVKSGVYDNLPGQIAKDGATYRPKGGSTSPYIITFESDHTEWEMAEIRTYLQRPIINVDRLIASIADSAFTITGKRLVIDPSIITDTHNILGMWLTLPLINSKYRSQASITIGEALEDTMSPADYLVELAKVFGWVFRTEPDQVTLMSRNAWFDHGMDTIDLTKRVDTSSIGILPLFAEKRFFDFAFPSVGVTAERYLEQTGREYNSLRVDTNYGFNDESINVLDKTPFKSSALEQERSLSYISAFCTIEDGEVVNSYLPQTAFEKVTAQMFKVEGGVISDSPASLDIDNPAGVIIEDTALFEDWLPKFQAHDSDNKSEDGEGILMYFNGMEESPAAEYDDAEGTLITLPNKRYYITGYDAARVALNDGKDCWDLRRQTSYVTEIPMFDQGGTYVLRFGSLTLAKGIYETYWKNYITDIYDKDTCCITCKVDLSGFKVDEVLLRRFYWFDNSIWVLNKISNHSLTTYDPVECEFVRVQDMDNYINGQI